MKLMAYISDHADPFFEQILANFVMLSQTEKGLNVIKALIASLNDIRAQSLIVEAIVDRAQSFIENQYSNYAFQMIIKKWPFIITEPLFSLILNKLPYYSLQRCSSNVVEAIIYNAPIECKLKYISELIESKDLTSMNVISNDG